MKNCWISIFWWITNQGWMKSLVRCLLGFQGFQGGWAMVTQLPLIFNSETYRPLWHTCLSSKLVWIEFEIFLGFVVCGEAFESGSIEEFASFICNDSGVNPRSEQEEHSEHSSKVDWSLSHCHCITFLLVWLIKFFESWCVCVCKGTWVRACGNLTIMTFRASLEARH